MRPLSICDANQERCFSRGGFRQRFLIQSIQKTNALIATYAWWDPTRGKSPGPIVKFLHSTQCCCFNPQTTGLEINWIEIFILVTLFPRLTSIQRASPPAAASPLCCWVYLGCPPDRRPGLWSSPPARPPGPSERSPAAQQTALCSCEPLWPEGSGEQSPIRTAVYACIINS